MRTAVFYNFLIEANIMSTIAILLMIIFRKVLRKQLGNKVICFGWLLTAIRLLCPLTLPNPLINQIRSPFATDPAIRPIAGQVKVRFQDLLEGFADAAFTNGDRTWINRVNSIRSNVENANISILLVKIWLIGFLAITLWFVISNIWFRRKMHVGRIEPISGRLLEEYTDLCKRRNVKQLPVYFTDPLPSACLVGVFRPYIALPLTSKPQETIHVLTHEVCHYANHDNLWSMLRLLCCMVHWFNPFVWIAANMTRTDQELRCDDRVTTRMNIQEKQEYASVLVLAASKRNAPGVPVLATGMTMTGRRLMNRVKAVLNDHRPVRWLTVSFCLIAAICLLGAFSTGEASFHAILNGYLAASSEMSEVRNEDEAIARVKSVWTGTFENVICGYATDGLTGNAKLTDAAMAADYANVLWEKVLGGHPSEYMAEPFGDRYQVNGFAADNGGGWQMTISDSGIVADYTATYPDPESSVSVDPENYQTEVQRASEYLMTVVDELAPGIRSRITVPVLADICRCGETMYFHYSFVSAYPMISNVFVAVRQSKDGSMQVVQFTAEGNG